MISLQESDEYNPGGSSRQSQHLSYIQVQNQDQVMANIFVL